MEKHLLLVQTTAHPGQVVMTKGLWEKIRFLRRMPHGGSISAIPMMHYSDD